MAGITEELDEWLYQALKHRLEQEYHLMPRRLSVEKTREASLEQVRRDRLRVLAGPKVQPLDYVETD